MREKDKICIVGAGPAGLVTALFLAKYNIECHVLEKATFPRQKPCGDCITGNVLRILNELEPNLLNDLKEKGLVKPIKGFTSYADNLSKIKFDYHPLEAGTNEPSCYTIERKNFDNILLDLAKSSPLIEITEGFSVKDVQFHADRVDVFNKSGQKISATCLVNATGSNSKLGEKHLQMNEPKGHTAIGIRAYFEGVELSDSEFCEFYISRKLMPGGVYVSPLPDNRVNVNMVVLQGKEQKEKMDLKETFKQFLESSPIGYEKFGSAVQLGSFEGSRLRLGTTKRKIHSDRYLAVGDAAGLIDILSANGIPQAFMSAQIAAKHIKDCVSENNFSAAQLKNYEKHVFKRTNNYLKVGRLAAPFLKNNAVLSIINYFVNNFLPVAENNKLLDLILYGKKKKNANSKVKLYQRLLYGMKS